jgi:hypothetical protein
MADLVVWCFVVISLAPARYETEKRVRALFLVHVDEKPAAAPGRAGIGVSTLEILGRHASGGSVPRRLSPTRRGHRLPSPKHDVPEEVAEGQRATSTDQSGLEFSRAVERAELCGDGQRLDGLKNVVEADGLPVPSHQH